MKTTRPTAKEISEALRRLEALRAELLADGAHFRAVTVGLAIDLIKRLAPSRGDGDGN